MAAASIGVHSLTLASGTSITSTAVTTQATGSTFIVASSSSSFDTLTDNYGNTYTKVHYEAVSGGPELNYWHCVNGVGGSGHQVTAGYGSSGARGLLFIEVVDGRGYYASTAGQDASSPYTISQSTAVNDSVFVLVALSDSSSNPATTSESTGFTKQEEITNGATYWPGALFTKTGVSAGTTETPSVTQGGSSSAALVLGVYYNGPIIDSQPVDTTAEYDTTATFTVSATTSGGALTYQWEISSDGGSFWENAPWDSTESTYTTDYLSFSDDGYLYRVQVTDDNGTTVSRQALLTVPSPAILAQPENQTVTPFDSAIVSVYAISGYDEPTYQWFFSPKPGDGFEEISGATSSSYTSEPLLLENNGCAFIVYVADSSGGRYSNPAVITVEMITPVASGGMFDPAIFDSLIFDTGAGATIVDVTGVAATGQLDTVTVTGDSPYTVSGLEATGQLGTVTVTGDSPYTVSGLAATGELGAVTVTGDSSYTVSGLEATGQLGTVTVTGDSPYTVSGLAATGELGAVTVTGDSPYTVSGLAATGELGAVTVVTVGDIIVPVTGVSATGELGTPIVVDGEIALVTGVAATGELGTPTITGGSVYTVSGLTAIGQLGSSTVTGGSTYTVSGVGATGQLGVVVVSTTQDALVPVNGVEAAGQVGSVVVVEQTVVLLTGVYASCTTSGVNVWGLIPNPQTPDWGGIGTTQAPVWMDVSNTQSTAWTVVGSAQYNA